MNVAEFIIEQLATWGVRHVYGVTGDAILPFMDALAWQDRLRFVPVRQEAAAGFMASAEWKLTGRLSVCVGTSGPGLVNLLNGLGDAYADRVPVLALTGQVESYKVGTDVKQEVNQQALLQGIAGYTALLAGPGAAPHVLTRALKTAIGEGRVAQVSVPKDYWTAPLKAAVHPPEPYLTAPPVPAEGVLREAAERLRQARRPVILAGHGSRPAAAHLLPLAEAWTAGIVLALGGKGAVPGSHPLVLGGVGRGGSDAAHGALSRCDLVLVAGSTWWPQQQMPDGVPVIQVDRCPANIGARTAVTYGIAGDCREVLPALAGALRENAGPADRTEWREELGRRKRDWETRLAAEARVAAPDGSVTPARLAGAVERAAPPGAIITLDTGDHLLWFNRHVRGDGQWVLFSGTWRSMGFGLPAASAAALCHPDARVIALVGDGGLTMTLGELAVPAQQGLNLTVIVARNGSLAMEEHKAGSEGLQSTGHVLNNPDFAAVARAFQWKAWSVEAPSGLDRALDEAVAHPGPALVDVRTFNDPALYLTPKS